MTVLLKAKPDGAAAHAGDDAARKSAGSRIRACYVIPAIFLIVTAAFGGLFGCASAADTARPLEQDVARSQAAESTAEAQGLRQAAEKTLAERSVAADRGDPIAQSQMGAFYLGGQVNGVSGVVPVDHDLALKWLLRAAGQKERLAPFYLGTLFFERQEYPTALKWFLAAAEQGVPMSYHYLGRIYRHGLGTDRDEKLALYWELRDLKSRKLIVTP